MASEALDGLSAGERARIEAMLDRDSGDGDDDFPPPEPVGLARRILRFPFRLLCVALIGAVGWHVFALATLKSPYDAVHVPVPLTLGSGIIAFVMLLWFDGKGQRLPILLLGLAALGLCGLSMRWVDSSAGGVRESWSGLVLRKVQLGGDLCYRIDSRVFELRGSGHARFAYPRGIWPGTFSDSEFKRYFFSDLPMRAGAGGWTCVAR
jgi:hypothetical protein